MPVFDFEYVFLKIRCKSVGETAELSILCPDDEETRVPVNINLDEIDVQSNDEHSNTIDISDKIKIVLRWPTVKDVVDLNIDNADDLVEHVIKLMHRCVTEITDGDKIYNRVDMSDKELTEFIDMLPPDIFEQIGDFFETMPKLKHTVEVVNPKTKKKSKITLEGLQSFFA